MQKRKGDKIMENSIRVLKEWNEERSKDAMERYYSEKMLEKEELGYEQGKTKGLAKGLKQGKEESNLIIAKKMLEDDVEIPTIAKYTDLSIKEINALK